MKLFVSDRIAFRAIPPTEFNGLKRPVVRGGKGVSRDLALQPHSPNNLDREWEYLRACEPWQGPRPMRPKRLDRIEWIPTRRAYAPLRT
jgi:hypothetical protein